MRIPATAFLRPFNVIGWAGLAIGDLQFVAPRDEVVLAAGLAFNSAARAAEEVLPKHITPETLKAVKSGLDYLARTQSTDGAWHDDQGGRAYPMACTSLAGTALLAHGNTASHSM